MNDISLIQEYTAGFSIFFSFQYYGRLYRIAKAVFIFLFGVPFALLSTVKLFVLVILKLLGMGITKILAIIPPVSLIVGIAWSILFMASYFILTILMWFFYIPDAICKFTGNGWFPKA